MKIFSPDNFSDPLIKYKKTDTALPWFKEVLRKYFTTFKVEEYFKLVANNVNSENYKIVLKLGSLSRPLLLRRYKSSLNVRQAELYLQFVEELGQRGVKISPALVNLAQTRIASWGADHFAIFDFLESKHWSPSRQSLASMAKTVAQMHLASSELEPLYGRKIKNASRQNTFYYNHVKTYQTGDFTDLERLVQKNNHKTAADQLYLKKMPKLLETVQAISEQRRRIQALPTGIIHSDLHPHNILMQGNKVRAIIDFDAMRVSQYARDVAFAIYRLGRQFFVKKKYPLKPRDLPPLFLDHYEKNRPLSAEEKRLLPLLIKDELLTKIIHVFRLIYLEKKHFWDQFVASFIVAIDEVDYFWPKR